MQTKNKKSCSFGIGVIDLEVSITDFFIVSVVVVKDMVHFSLEFQSNSANELQKCNVIPVKYSLAVVAPLIFV